MSTRAGVGWVEGDSFKLAFSHWDGSPRSLGAEIWKLLHERCGGDVEYFVGAFLKEHPHWSFLGGSCHCHPERSDEADWRQRIPRWDPHITEQQILDGDDQGMEYLYVLHGNVMTIGEIGDRSWELLAQVPLDGSEPDWTAIEASQTTRLVKSPLMNWTVTKSE